MLTWVSRDEQVDFELSILTSQPEGDFQWTAVAFSEDQLMGDDSVVDCVFDESQDAVVIQSSWNNPDKTNDVLNDVRLL